MKPLAVEPSRPIIAAGETQTKEFTEATKWLDDELHVTANANLQTCSDLANKLTDPTTTKQTWHSRPLLKQWGVTRQYKTLGGQWKNRHIEDIKHDLCQSLLRRIEHIRSRTPPRSASHDEEKNRDQPAPSTSDDDDSSDLSEWYYDAMRSPAEDEAFIAELKRKRAPLSWWE